MEKEKIRPLYSEFLGYLSQAPISKDPYQGSDKPSTWNHYNSAIEILNKTTGEDYNRFKINSSTDGGGEKYVPFTIYRQKLSGLIATLHAEYFSDEPFPLGGSPDTIITLSQQQAQSFYVQMLLDIQSKIDGNLKKYGEGSKERGFLKKVKDSLSSISNFTQLLGLIIKTAKEFGLTIDNVSEIFC